MNNIRKPKKTTDTGQVLFWTKEWQDAEKEAEADLKAGKIKKFKNVEDLIKDLDQSGKNLIKETPMTE